MAREPNQSADETAGRPNHYLKEWREFMGWSQEDLGDMANVHYTKIGRIENGKRELKSGFLRELARIFKVPPSSLLEINPATNEGAQTAELLLAWGELPADKRADILTMVRALAPRDRKNEAS